MIFIKEKFNKIYSAKFQRSRGFVILFAVILASIILAITLGISNIALRELKFSTSAKDTNEAFFAADTGAECALFNDKADINRFSLDLESPATINCFKQDISSNPKWDSHLQEEFVVVSAGTWNFILGELGSSNNGCAIVSVAKDDEDGDGIISTTITSKGYNVGSGGSAPNWDCVTNLPNNVERVLEVTY